MPYKDPETRKISNREQKRRNYQRKGKHPIRDRKQWFKQNYTKSDLNKLSSRQRTIIELYFGVNITKALNLADIAALQQISRVRAGQLKKEALEVLDQN